MCIRDRYDALQASEQARSAVAERERLLQEMHDGMGAQLTSAKMLASSGQLSCGEMVDTLDACLREMRLTVDALSVTDGDLALLLATLPHRLEPVLRAGGITPDWRVDDPASVPVRLAGCGGCTTDASLAAPAWTSRRGTGSSMTGPRSWPASRRGAAM